MCVRALGQPQTLCEIQENPRKGVTGVRAPKAYPQPQGGPLHTGQRLRVTIRPAGPRGGSGRTLVLRGGLPGGAGPGRGALVRPQGCLSAAVTETGSLGALGNPWEFLRPSRAASGPTVSTQCLHNSGK